MISGPLSDLHRHLDGSLRPATLADLGRAVGCEVPDDLRFEPGMGLEAALGCFRTTLAVLQSPAAVARVAAEICEDASREGVETLEVRFAPQLHREAPMARIVDAALDGIGGRAGLVLCALYGEPPDLVQALIDVAEPRLGVVGIDLAGGPAPGHAFGLLDYREPFRRARRLGLGTTVHAGEGRPPGEIRQAVVELEAQRIGHGTSLLDEPELVPLLIERQVVVEACPTSNVHTGAIAAVAEHPLPRWLDAGLRACINTDNTLLSRVDAPEEYRRAAAIPGMTPARLRDCAETGRLAAFRR